MFIVLIPTVALFVVSFVRPPSRRHLDNDWSRSRNGHDPERNGGATEECAEAILDGVETNEQEEKQQ